MPKAKVRLPRYLGWWTLPSWSLPLLLFGCWVTYNVYLVVLFRGGR